MMTAIRKNLADFLAVLGVIVLGLGIGVYVLSNQRLRFPLVEEPFYTVKAELPDAQAVTPGQGQTVVVAGVRVGDIGAVELEDGKAVVELQLEPRYKGLLREDATALLRAKTGTKDMFLEVDPGDGKPLPKDGRIRVSNTLPDIDPDEFLAALDSDTRNYLKLLISGAGKGLEGRGTDLRETLKRLGPVHKDLARVTRAVAERRHNLRRLVNRYGLLMAELGKSDDDITRLVRASNTTLGAFADEDQNISSLVSKLPGTLNQTATTLAKVDTLADQMGPTFESLRAPFSKLDEANAAVKPFVEEAAPILKNQVRPFARAAQPFQRDLGAASANLAKANPDLTDSFRGLNRLFDIGAYNPGGSEGISEGCEKAGACTREERARNEGGLYWLAWIGQNTNSLFSTADALGPIRRAYLLNLNCGVFSAGAKEAGMPDAEADGLADLFGGIGACSTP
ncbi:MAG TPA: MlaD family protein [Thermoleophilaceae bacterium]|jgi:phospholipid/cholesterol/gamma-HCH transport system substrate-binding protein